MANTYALETLLSMAVKSVDDAAKHLGFTMQTKSDAESKLSILQKYRDDYAARFQEDLKTGMSPMDYRNFQLFIEKVDKAIAGQEDILKQMQERVEQARQYWQQCERKRLTYDTLIKRAKDAQIKRENKLDQKLMDEYATRMSFYKK